MTAEILLSMAGRSRCARFAAGFSLFLLSLMPETPENTPHGKDLLVEAALINHDYDVEDLVAIAGFLSTVLPQGAKKELARLVVQHSLAKPEDGSLEVYPHRIDPVVSELDPVNSDKLIHRVHIARLFCDALSSEGYDDTEFAQNLADSVIDQKILTAEEADERVKWIWAKKEKVESEKAEDTWVWVPSSACVGTA